MNAFTRRLAAAIERRAAAVPRRMLACKPGRVGVIEEELRLVSGAGYPLHVHLHRPTGPARPRPSVLLCPGIDAPGSVFDGWKEVLNATEVARLGLLVAHFDPAGRGRSWGVEDQGGPEHQDDVRTVLRFLLGRPDTIPERSGVISISMGVAMAVGALARYGEELPVGWLLDWEGPSDREIITAGGRLMKPAMGHGSNDETWWGPREAVRHVGRLRCGYLRFQAERDHAQPGELRHALRMMQAAEAGSLPWFQLNDHPKGRVPETPVWYPSGPRAANRILLTKIRELCALDEVF
jgi:hypothetical protein